jgi:glycine betaine/choline ABC-type transport system substrate-binding protein
MLLFVLTPWVRKRTGTIETEIAQPLHLKEVGVLSQRWNQRFRVRLGAEKKFFQQSDGSDHIR